MNLINKLRLSSTFIKYAVIGGFSAGLDFVVFVLLFNLGHLEPVLATIISTSVGIINSFLLNAFFNFRLSNKLLKRFISFYIVGLIGLLLSAFVIYVLHNELGLNADLAKLISIPVIVAVQYILNSRFSFGKNPDQHYDSIRNFIIKYWPVILTVVVCVVLYFAAIFYNYNVDETDNMLGGKLIDHGSLPYAGFFSQHTPGMYFLGALLFPFSNNSPFQFRLAFDLLSFGLLLVNTYVAYRKINKRAAYAYLILASVGHIVADGQMAVAESLVFYLLPLAFMLVFFKRTRVWSYRRLAFLSLVLFSVPFLSLGYIYPAAVIYIPLLADLWLDFRASRALRSSLIKLGILAAPYILSLTALVVTGALSTFKFDVLTYNAKYYAPMVGEQGGNPAKTLIAIVAASVNQIGTVVTNIFNPAYTTQALLLLGFLIVGSALWLSRKRREAVLLAVLVLVLDTRVNIFHAPAIITPIGQLSHHALIYIGFALLMGSIVIGHITNAKLYKQEPFGSVLCIVAIVYVLIVPIAFLKLWTNDMQSVFIKKDSVSFLAYSKDSAQHNPAQLINKWEGKNGTAWIGPADLESQLYLEPARASKFTFYFPWVDVSPELRQELVSELGTQRPKVIYFTYYDNYTYSAEFENFLHSHYVTSSDPRYKYYYFLKGFAPNDVKQSLVEDFHA